MHVVSFDKLLKASHGAQGSPMDRGRGDLLQGRVDKSPPGESARNKSLYGLSRQFAGREASGLRRATGPSNAGLADPRQRAVVKVRDHLHAGGGGAALKAHLRYIGRDLTTRDERDGVLDRIAAAEATPSLATQGNLRPGEGRFYDRESQGVDAPSIAAAWARSDERHYRFVISPEYAGRLHDLTAYVREVMAHCEGYVGGELQWVAIDHWDTPNPHAHLVVRGRRATGKDLELTRRFIRHDFLSIARDVATAWLGPRTHAHERNDYLITYQGPTALDRVLACQIEPDVPARVGDLTGFGPAHASALKARARALAEMGLAHETHRNELVFLPDWQARLMAIERDLTAQRRLMSERQMQRTRSLLPSPERLGLGPIR